MKYLITSSLLDGYDWLKTCPKNWQDRAMDDFVSMIRREPRPTSEACQRGIDFENLVCENMDKPDSRQVFESYYIQKGLDGERLERAVETAFGVADLCKGGEKQVPVSKDIEVGGEEFHLYGYADIVLPDKIIDIKTTAWFKGSEAYEKRSQHLLYSLCTGIGQFEYLVAEFKGKWPCGLKRIAVSVDEESSKCVLSERIAELSGFLKRAGLWEDYVEVFTEKHKDKK